MVILILKRRDESVFLYESVTSIVISELIKDILKIYNLTLKIHYYCQEIENLANYGVTLPTDKQGLDEEISNLSDQHEPVGGFIINKDPLLKRCGKAPVERMKDILFKCLTEAKLKIGKEQINNNICLTTECVESICESLKGAISIPFPLGLPSHDPLFKVFENEPFLEEVIENLDTDIIKPENAELWWASKILDPDKSLKDYVGKNEKTKIIVKLQKTGQGPPPKEPTITEEEKAKLLSQYYKKVEELKDLEEDDEESYLDSKWANNHQLKHAFLGLKGVQWKPE